MVDYVTLMLVNAGAGFMILAFYLMAGAREEDQRKWAAALAVPGLISVATGLHMTFAWPLPGPYNMLFGEVSVMFGAVLVGLAWCAARGVSRVPVAIYAFFAGLVVLGLGGKIMELLPAKRVTQMPHVTAAGFLCSGVGGMLLAGALALRKTWLRAIAAFFLICAGVLWFATGFVSYRVHLKMWTPTTAPRKAEAAQDRTDSPKVDMKGGVLPPPTSQPKTR